MPSPSPLFINPTAKEWRYTPSAASQETQLSLTHSRAQTFHRQLPHYAPTPLHSLPSVARALGLGHVLLKDESSRFGLPSFKVLGASWAVYRAVAAHLGVHVDDATTSHDLSSLGRVGKEGGLSPRLVTCTEGNWGRAVAWMARLMGLEVKPLVFVPGNVPASTRELVRVEGAEVRVVEGGYEDAFDAARRAAEVEGGLLVMDIGWEGYEVVPQVCLVFVNLISISKTHPWSCFHD